MVARKSLNSQLANIGLHFRVFGRGEVKELQKILRIGENIYQCAYGYYHGGSGLLVVTDQRILLLDKRTLFLNLEELAFKSVTKVNVQFRALQAILTIQCSDKKLVFRSLSDARIRNISMYIKEVARRLSEQNENVISNEISSAKQVNVWRVNSSALVPRLRPTKFYGVSLEH